MFKRLPSRGQTLSCVARFKWQSDIFIKIALNSDIFSLFKHMSWASALSGGSINLKVSINCLCRCLEQKMDATCQHVSCRNYCQNGATCNVNNNLPTCECTADYTGTTCTILRDPQIITTAEQDGIHKGGNTWGIVAWAAAVILIVAGLALALIGFEAVFKRRPVFSHERLQENDFTNPMYQERDAEPFTLDADKVKLQRENWLELIE